MTRKFFQPKNTPRGAAAVTASQVACLTAGGPARHVDDDREVVVAGVQVPLAWQHRELELVKHQQLLRQVVAAGQRREPADHAVHLA